MDLSLHRRRAGAFAAEVRAWLAAHVDVPPRFASLDDEVAWGSAWQAKLAADALGRDPLARAEYGGRGASPVQVAIFNMEYARSRALQPVNRVGINLAGPTLLAHGTDEQKQRWLPRDPHRRRDLVPAVQRARRGLRPRVAADHACRARRRRLAALGSEGVDVATRSSRGGGSASRVPTPTRRSTGASRTWSSTWQAPGIEVRPLVQITGEAEFNEVFFDEVFVPADHLVGGLHDGWAVANTTLAHERGTAFPFKEQVVHEVYLDELTRSPRERRELDDVEVADALAQTFVELRRPAAAQLADVVAAAHGIEPGPESSSPKFAWTDMTPALSPTPRSTSSARRAAVVRRRPTTPAAGSGNVSGCGRRPRRSPAARREVQRTIIGDRMLGLPAKIASRADGQVTGLDHIVLVVADVERGARVLLRELGLEAGARRGVAARRGLLPVGAARRARRSSTSSSAGEPDRTSTMSVSSSTDRSPRDGRLGPFRCRQRAGSALGARGDGRSLYVLDPDGNVVELRHYG